jgi:hypothetical protein
MDEKVDATLDRLLVEFGKEILKIVPGKVSTEVDARFSFDVQGSINKALHIIEVRYQKSQRSTLLILGLALRVNWNQEGAHSYQVCINLGGYQGCPRTAVEARR